MKRRGVTGSRVSGKLLFFCHKLLNSITAGIFVPLDKQGYIPDEKWTLTYSINVTGPYLVADEAKKIWQAQGLKSSLVITTSANAAVAKQGSFAYDTSKAAANHLVCELAIELAPQVRVNGLAPAGWRVANVMVQL